jgi:hypothetical protein
VVSCWTTPKDLVAALSREADREVAIKTIPADVFAKDFPENIAGQLTETLSVVGEYSIYGKGEDKKQP